MTDGWLMDAFGDGSDLPANFGPEPPYDELVAQLVETERMLAEADFLNLAGEVLRVRQAVEAQRDEERR